MFAGTCSALFTGPWTAAEYPDVAKWLDGYTDVLEVLAQICSFEKCRFPIEPRYFADSSARYNSLRSSSKLLISAANRDIGQGRVEAGLQKYLCALQVARHVYQQPSIMGFLVSAGTDALCLRGLCTFIVEDAGTVEQLDLIARAIDIEDNWAYDWPKVLAVTKLQVKNLLGLFYERNLEGKTRFSRRFFADLQAELDSSEYADETESTTAWERNLVNRLTLVFVPLVAPYSPRTVGRIVDDMYDPAASASFDWNRLDEYEQYRLAKMRKLYGAGGPLRVLGPDAWELLRLRDFYMRLLALRRGCRILIVLRRYKNENGHWPEHLEDIKDHLETEMLIDPINSGSFVYKLSHDGFRLYSKGKNNIDEGGKREDDADDWPIWPPRSRITEEENTDAE
jgi:hypothetical protein